MSEEIDKIIEKVSNSRPISPLKNDFYCLIQKLNDLDYDDILLKDIISEFEKVHSSELIKQELLDEIDFLKHEIFLLKKTGGKK